MIERLVVIDEIDPVLFFGVGNANFDVVRQLFPMVKLVARGDTLKVAGEEGDVALFADFYDRAAQFCKKYARLTPDDLRTLAYSPAAKGPEGGADMLVYGNNGRIIKALTSNQRKMVEAHQANDLLFAEGPAGSGKTYTAIALAVRALRAKEVKRIVLSRPAVEAGERLGFLPGDLKEKIDPYLQPLYDALNDMLPPKKLEASLDDGTVQIAPLAFMRGRTLDNAFVILDEAQNATVNQLKMFLTRMGKHSKFIVNGDVTQIDLPRNEPSGLVHAMRVLDGIAGIGMVRLTQADIVRHPLVPKIVKAYDDDRRRRAEEKEAKEARKPAETASEKPTQDTEDPIIT